VRGFSEKKFLVLFYKLVDSFLRMIDKKRITTLVNQWLEGKEYFLTDVSVSADNRIVVEIDHKDGVWIEDCVALSRYVESGLDRDTEDFELEVGSAGLGQPFKVRRQYDIHVGDPVEVIARDGKKYVGALTAVDDEGFNVEMQQKVKEEGMKRPKMMDVSVRFAFDEVKETRYFIDFK